MRYILVEVQKKNSNNIMTVNRARRTEIIPKMVATLNGGFENVVISLTFPRQSSTPEGFEVKWQTLQSPKRAGLSDSEAIPSHSGVMKATELMMA